MTAPVIRARSLAVGRGRGVVLRDVDLDVAAGEHIAVVGANGCGKTTLLRALAGLDRVRAGSLCYRGRALGRGPERTRTLGVLLQTETPTGFRVRDVVALGFGLDRVPTAAERAVADSAIARAGLGAVALCRTDRLSGGQWQRVRLARAVVADPAALLLDEPTAHLDPAGRAALTRFLAPTPRRRAVVIATHDLDVAVRCDRIALLGRGRLQGVIRPHAPEAAERLADVFGVPGLVLPSHREAVA